MTDLVGVPLDFYTETLHKVADEFNTEPWNSFDGYENIPESVMESIKYHYWYRGEEPSFNKIATNLSMRHMCFLSFDQLCKVRHSSFITLDMEVDRLFTEGSKQHMIFHKIESSIWRWGMNRAKWNDVVDAYDGIRSFSLDLPDFEIRLDHTTSVNERGYSQYSRTYLDGVFSYLVYYKGQHVMTLGFSITADRQILIQQIQLVKQRGNRFLYKMPANRVEFVIERFRAAFPGHTLCIVDGAMLAEVSLTSYRDCVSHAREVITKMELKKSLDDWDTRGLKRAVEALAEYQEKVASLEADIPRLKKFYATTGRFKRSRKQVRINRLTHYPLAA